jgi:hypothetical protein
LIRRRFASAAPRRPDIGIVIDVKQVNGTHRVRPMGDLEMEEAQYLAFENDSIRAVEVALR